MITYTSQQLFLAWIWPDNQKDCWWSTEKVFYSIQRVPPEDRNWQYQVLGHRWYLILVHVPWGYGNRFVCVSVCLLPRNLLPISYLHWKQSFIWSFLVFSRFLSCDFHWKCFAQEFWCHLLVTAAFLKSLASFQWTRDYNGFFSTRIVCMISDRSNNMTGSLQIVAQWERSFLAICACYKLRAVRSNFWVVRPVIGKAI